MNRYYMDRVAAINLDGIRCVQRSDGYGAGFSIQVTYKGNNFSLTYSSREDRDDAFNQILHELSKRNKDKDNANNQ